MQAVTVGDAEIPVLGLGTWPMRGRSCTSSVAEALALGYRHIDTAQMYGNEAEVGAGVRASGVPATRCSSPPRSSARTRRRDGCRRASRTASASSGSVRSISC